MQIYISDNDNDQTNNTRSLHDAKQNSNLQSGNLDVAANTDGFRVQVFERATRMFLARRSHSDLYVHVLIGYSPKYVE